MLGTAGFFGCRYQNFMTDTPFDDVDCSEAVGPEGAEFDVPGCSCGIRLRYVTTPAKDGNMDIHYEVIRGHKTAAIGDDSFIKAYDRHEVAELHIAGEKLPPYEECDAQQREYWDTNKTLYRGWMRRYGGRLNSILMTCHEDRLDDELEAVLED